MALNRSDRCSTCLRKCYVTTGQKPIQMSCGHHTCFRCHQTQWLTSERNDSEEINCIKCTLAVLNDQSNNKPDLLKRHLDLFRSANVGSVIKGVREPKAQVDSADKIRSHAAKEDTCSSDTCSQYYRGVHHHRAHSSPANVFPAATETEMNSTRSHESCKAITLRNKDIECSRQPSDKIYKLEGMSSLHENVLRFTPLDQKQKYEHSKNAHKNNTRAKFLSPETSSQESSVSVIKKAEAHVKQPSDSRPSMQTYSRTGTSVNKIAYSPPHDQYDNVGQNEVDSTVTSDNGSKSSGRSHQKQKSSHKRSRKKDKHRQKNSTKYSQDLSLHVTGTPDGTKNKAKQLETSPKLCHLNTTSAVCKVEVGETLFIDPNNKDDSSPASGGRRMDTLSVAQCGQKEKLSFAGKKEDDKLFITANDEDVKLSFTAVSEGDMSVLGYAGSKSENKQENKIVDDKEEDRLPTVGNNEEEGSLCIAGNDDSESEGLVLRSPMMSLYASASSTRFSSPMSLDDYQLNNILPGNDTSELEVQDWGNSDGDNTELENWNRRDSKKRDRDLMTHEESYPKNVLHDTLLNKETGTCMESYQPRCDKPDLLHCSKNKNDLAETLETQVKQEGIETRRDKMSLDDSILDRSGILYYDPIDDSDEDRLVIISKPTSEVSLTRDDKTITKRKETSPTETTGDQSSATNNSVPEKNSHLGKTEVDHNQLKFTNACKAENKPTQENYFVRGFQESYIISVVCSQMANKALKMMKESGEYQKGPYQLSAKMLTDVLNILVQQANLASTICSELLNSRECKQSLSYRCTDVSHTHQESTFETPADHEPSFGAKTDVTKDLISGTMCDTSDPSSNACSLNASAPSCSTFTFETHSGEENNVITVSCISEKEKGNSINSSSQCSAKETSSDMEKHSSKGNFSTATNASSKNKSQNGNWTPRNTTISKSTDKSEKGKYSKDFFVNYDNLDRKESQSHSKETVCVHQEKSVKTKDVGLYDHKNKYEQINDNPTHNKTLDIPCSEHEMERRKVRDAKNDSPKSGLSDLPIVGMQDNVNDVVTDHPLILSDIISVEKKTPYLPVEGTSLGTQVAESKLETAGHKLDKENVKITDNQLQDVVEEDKHCIKGKEKDIIHPGKIKDKDMETRNSTNNKPKSSEDKDMETRNFTNNKSKSSEDKDMETRNFTNNKSKSSEDKDMETRNSTNNKPKSSKDKDMETRNSTNNKPKSSEDKDMETRNFTNNKPKSSEDKDMETRNSTNNKSKSSEDKDMETRNFTNNKPKSSEDKDMETRNFTNNKPKPSKDKDMETRNSTNNKPKSSKEKRNLFDSLFEIEESVVESPCKYRKLQFGKLPQSRTEGSTQVDTPVCNHDKGSLGTIDTTSLSNQRCRDGTTSSRQGSGSTKKSKGSHQLAVANKQAETVSVVSTSSTPTTEIKLKTIASVKSSTKRSSSVPSVYHNKDRKDGSNSRSRYHSSCGISEKDSSITHQRSGSLHRNTSSHRKSLRSSDGEGRKVQGSVSIVIHGDKRDIRIQTEAQMVNQTPGKSKEKVEVEKENTISQLLKATSDVSCYVQEGITQEKTKESVNKTNSKDKNDAIVDQSISRNNNTEGHDIEGDFLDLRCPVDMQQRRHCSSSLPTGFLELSHLDSESTNSSVGKPCDTEHATGLITSKVEKCNEDLFVPVSCYSNDTSTTVLDVEEDAYLLTTHDEIYTQQSLARDEDTFKCLSFSDSDNDVPLAQIVEKLKGSKGKSTSTADRVNEWEDDQLPKLTVPKTSKYWRQPGHRRSRCDRPGLKTYLEIRNALPDTSTDQCSITPEKTWRNSLMPPPLEAERRSKSREKASQSTSTDSHALSETETIPPRSEDVSGNLSSESEHESDLEHANYCDVEGWNRDTGERGGSSKKKKKRHRRKKSDKPVVSSSSEEYIPKGRKRGFQWRQECLRILDRVYNHEFSDPFRHEVKSKDIPDYYKIVKRGMCFDIIGYKLRCNIYEELRDFFLDVRLVFDNCRLYHKPESPIYQAGLIVRCFFRKVAKEILMPRTTARSRHPS